MGVWNSFGVVLGGLSGLAIWIKGAWGSEWESMPRLYVWIGRMDGWTGHFTRKPFLFFPFFSVSPRLWTDVMHLACTHIMYICILYSILLFPPFSLCIIHNPLRLFSKHSAATRSIPHGRVFNMTYQILQ